MRYFSDSDELYLLLQKLFKQIGSNNSNASKVIMDSRLSIQIRFNDPKAEVFIDGRKNPVQISYRTRNSRPDFDVELPADMFHKIMTGNVNMKKAIASGKFKVRGPIWKAFVLEDIFKTAKLIYPEVIQEMGLT